ncbi:MAG: ribonuclease P protein component [Chloroflexi bacterium]|nr:ribonuclease P protein component [Chloroflexota bacterium]MCI0577631.1 ribonuclease P protein component [Chloroflexota bacterium]MCI0644149.1 ribonuclease P protein component [Chloroflexota bacterium]MCI0725268.1 ribonuclease P protein component [Chloroflexota bacterium]
MQRRFRLRRQADFEQLRHHGQRWRHPLALLIVVTNHQTVSRFGFSASKRVGKATVRNRARRLLREAVRLHLHEISQGWDCLFVARQETADAPLAEVEAAVLQLLGRAGVLALEQKPGLAEAPGS